MADDKTVVLYLWLVIVSNFFLFFFFFKHGNDFETNIFLHTYMYVSTTVMSTLVI